MKTRLPTPLVDLLLYGFSLLIRDQAPGIAVTTFPELADAFAVEHRDAALQRAVIQEEEVTFARTRHDPKTSRLPHDLPPQSLVHQHRRALRRAARIGGHRTEGRKALPVLCAGTPGRDQPGRSERHG